MNAFWRLISQVKDFKYYFISAIFSNILTAVFTVISIPLIIPFFQILFDQKSASKAPTNGTKADLLQQLESYFVYLIETYDKQTALLAVCIMISVVFLLKNLFRYLSMYFMAPVRNGIVRNTRSRLYNKYMELPLSYYSEERKGDLLSRIISDVQEIEWSILSMMEAIFKSPLIIIGALSFMIYISPSLTLFVIILLLFTAVVIGSVSKSLKKDSKNVQARIANINSVTEESLSGLRIIKAFNAEGYQSKKFEKENYSYFKSLTQLLRKRDLASPLSEFLGIIVVAILLWYGSNLVFENKLKPETFFALIFAFYTVIEPAKTFSNAYFKVQKGLAALDRIEEVLFVENTITEIAQPISKSNFTNSIELKNLSFAYEKELVLNSINLKINKGETIALVGPSGGGKSTLVDIFPRFHDPKEGSVLIDDLDTKDLKLTDLRALFGIVSQEAILFNDTVAENISFGKKANLDQIKQAAITANADSFIKDMPKGYDTIIGDRGVKLSGGQRQRLTIARAILRNPPIMILDEATSALDSESEKIVQGAINKLMENKTSIVIAHRLSTIVNADKIVVIDAGKITEIGTHTELLNLGGTYHKLHEMQSFS